MKVLLAIVGLLVIGVVGVLGYVGFIPGLSRVMGAYSAKDLGIRVTVQDSVDAQAKTGVTLMDLPPETPASESIQLSGSKPTSYEMDSTELTALANNRSWKYFPFENVQIRIHDDGSVESSGIIKLDAVMNYAQAIGYSQADVEKAMSALSIPHVNLPYYVKASGSVENDAVSLDIQSVSLARIPVPAGYVEQHTPAVVDIIEDGIARAPGFSIRSLQFGGGKMVFDGTVPETEAVVGK